jgi:ATP-dependent protease ClpP protease subunit
MSDLTLSEKRRRAGRRGAAARWGKQDEQDSWRPHLKTTRPVAKLRQGRDDWYRIENKAAAKAEVFIYDEIGYFGVTASDFVADLRDITAPQIVLHLNTPGGNSYDGIAIYNALRDHPAQVEVIVDSLAASAGSFIAQAGDRVVMNRGSQMMIHDAWGMAIGNAADMDEMKAVLDRQSDNIAGIYADRAGGEVAEWRELMRAESWFSADEAVEAGLADEVAGRDAATKNSFDLSVYTYAGREKAPAPAIPAPAPTPAPPNAEADLDFGEITKSLEEAFS